MFLLPGLERDFELGREGGKNYFLFLVRGLENLWKCVKLWQMFAIEKCNYKLLVIERGADEFEPGGLFS